MVAQIYREALGPGSGGLLRGCGLTLGVLALKHDIVRRVAQLILVGGAANQVGWCS